MISNDVSTTKTVRTVFIIDDKGIVRTIFTYPMNVGRCIPEILRTVEALQTSDKCDGSTPANWVNGNPLIQNIPQTYCELKERIKEINQNKNGMSWYLSFKDSCIQKDEQKNNDEKSKNSSSLEDN